MTLHTEKMFYTIQRPKLNKHINVVVVFEEINTKAHKANSWCDSGCGYRETTSAHCGGCGSHLRSPSADGCNVPSASCLPPSESVRHNMTHNKQDAVRLLYTKS